MPLPRSESQSGRANESDFKMLPRYTAFALSLLAFTSSALAEDLSLGCYINAYDKKHLAKHKGQTDTSISLKLYKITPGPDTTAAPMNAEVKVKLRNSKKIWSEDGNCYKNIGEWKCGIDCDGGNFRLSEYKNGITLFNIDGFRVSQDGCGEDNETVEAKPGNRMFRLSKADLSACK